MPQTPLRPDRSDGARSEGARTGGDFADLFARKARTPLRGFLPGRRVFNAVGGSLAVVLVVAGTTALVSRIDWSSGGADQVATAAKEKDAVKEEGAAVPATPTAHPTSAAPAEKDSDKGPDVVYLPAPGGSGGDGGSGSGNGSGSGSGSGGSGTAGDTSTDSGGTQDSSSRSADTTPQEPAEYLWSDGSVDSADDNGYWDQSVVTVKSTKALSSFKVVVKIIQTGGVASTGTWTSLGDKVTVHTGGTSGELDYVVTLNAGVTLDPGTYVLKFQFNHDQGIRDAGGDRYNVTATSTASVTEFRKGGF
jgi:hypothetical protein